MKNKYQYFLQLFFRDIIFLIKKLFAAKSEKFICKGCGKRKLLKYTVCTTDFLFLLMRFKDEFNFRRYDAIGYCSWKCRAKILAFIKQFKKDDDKAGNAFDKHREEIYKASANSGEAYRLLKKYIKEENNE